MNFKTPVSSNVLYQRSRLPDIRITEKTFEVEYDSQHSSGMGRKRTTLSFKPRRNAAVAELGKRGITKHDPSIFKTGKCWEIPDK
ncbi:hypothetical protein JW935_29090 [candidate division KSB1 bacterium]|nr:hypothetical protein [candidate division KSB1 bacterium]